MKFTAFVYPYFIWFYFFISPVANENVRLRLAIPTGVPITVPNDAIEMLPIVTDKTKTYQNNQKKQYTW